MSIASSPRPLSPYKRNTSIYWNTSLYFLLQKKIYSCQDVDVLTHMEEIATHTWWQTSQNHTHYLASNTWKRLHKNANTYTQKWTWERESILITIKDHKGLRNQSNKNCLHENLHHGKTKIGPTIQPMCTRERDRKKEIYINNYKIPQGSMKPTELQLSPKKSISWKNKNSTPVLEYKSKN